MTSRISASALALLVLGTGLAAAGEAGNAVDGQKFYRRFCTHCHGPNMINPGTGSFDLRKFEAAEEERFRTSLVNGKGNMPPFGKKLKPEEIDDLWAYVLTDGKL